MYDYVIVGAGSAGCVVAHRLGEDPDVRIAVIEAGPPDDAPEIHMPLAFGPNLTSDWDWVLFSEPEPGLLNAAGFPKARIVASSGFSPEKCRMMAAANAPIDVIGTGSYLPQIWTETYATADIIAYDGKPMVKAGREFLLRGKK
jgi:choline dehydrogenase-like flavoprotein